MGEHGLSGDVHSPAPRGDFLIRLALTGLPFRSEPPRLVAWHRHVAPDRDDPGLVDGELDLVALADAQRAPDLVGQGELCLRAKPGPSADARLWFLLGTRLVQGDPYLRGC